MKFLLFGLFCGTLLSPMACASVIFSSHTGIQTGGYSVVPTYGHAATFTPAGSLYLTDVSLWIVGHQSGSQLSMIDVYLMSDSGGVPGTIIENLGSLIAPNQLTYSLATRTASGTTLLSAGTPYWIAVIGNEAAVHSTAWGGGGNGPVATAFSNGTGINGTWVAQNNLNSLQMVINGESTPAGSSVPEPATVGLTAFALAAIWHRSRSRRRPA